MRDDTKMRWTAESLDADHAESSEAPTFSITFVGLNFSPERMGVGPYATRFCSGLAERGHQVTVITGVPHYPQWDVSPEYRWKITAHEDVEGLPTKRVRHMVPRNPSNARRLAMEMTFGLRAAVSGWQRPDVLICTSPALISTGIVSLRHWASGSRPALGLWVHDLYAVGLQETQNSSGAKARLLANVESRVLNHADGIAVLTDRFRAQLVQNLGVDPSKVTRIRNWNHIRGIQNSDRRDIRGRLGWSEDQSIVLHAGNMGVKQGLDNVVQAARIAEEQNSNLRFVLLGDGNQRRQLEENARGLSRLEFLDPVPEEDFASTLAAADILLLNELPGVSDMSIPSKLTSYFQSGRPVLAATGPDSTAAGEIRASGAGVQIPGGNPMSLFEAATRLASNPLLQDELGARGIQYADRELTEQASLDKFDRWITQLAASRRLH